MKAKIINDKINITKRKVNKKGGDTLFVKGFELIADRYRVIDIIGRGGTSKVFLVYDIRLKKRWALKEIRVDESSYEYIRESFFAETDALKTTNHVGVVNVIDAFTIDDKFYIVEDYINGVNLRDYVRNGISKEIFLIIILQICDILIYLHHLKNPIYHGDLKPENILIDKENKVSLIDFGISINHLKRRSSLLKRSGTKGYMSFEKEVFGLIDAKSDIYAFGMTLDYVLNKNPIKFKRKNIRNYKRIIKKSLDTKGYRDVKELKKDILKTETKNKRLLAVYVNICALMGALFLVSFLLVPEITVKIKESERRKYVKSLDEKYEDYLRKGDMVLKKEEKIKYYKEAINLDNTKMGGYYKLLDLFKEDENFDKEEEEEFIKIFFDNMNDIENERAYGGLCFEIGKLYWYYYENPEVENNADIGDTKNPKDTEIIKNGINTEGIKLSYDWFLWAGNEKYKDESYYDKCIVYRDISDFYKNLIIYQKEESDVDYLRYYKNLLALKGFLSTDNEMIRLRIISIVVISFDNYYLLFKKEGVDGREILKILDELKEKCRYLFGKDEKIKGLAEELGNKTNEIKLNVWEKEIRNEYVKLMEG